jgi:hypothetical protein
MLALKLSANISVQFIWSNFAQWGTKLIYADQWLFEDQSSPVALFIAVDSRSSVLPNQNKQIVSVSERWILTRSS